MNFETPHSSADSATRPSTPVRTWPEAKVSSEHLTPRSLIALGHNFNCYSVAWYLWRFIL